MFQGNIGDNSSNGAPFVPLQIAPGATITVAVTSGSAGSLITSNGADDSSPSTITAGSSSTFTAPTYMAAAAGKIASVQITGGNY